MLSILRVLVLLVAVPFVAPEMFCCHALEAINANESSEPYHDDHSEHSPHCLKVLPVIAEAQHTVIERDVVSIWVEWPSAPVSPTILPMADRLTWWPALWGPPPKPLYISLCTLTI